MPDDYRSIRQAAKLSGVDRNTVAKWINEGRLTARRGKVGRMEAKLVSVGEVRDLASKITVGRPPNDPGALKARSNPKPAPPKPAAKRKK